MLRRLFQSKSFRSERTQGCLNSRAGSLSRNGGDGVSVDAGVAQEKNGNLWAIQAKAYAANRPVNKDDMDRFISESEGDQFSLRLLLATSYKVGRNVTRLIDRYTPPLVFQMRHDLDQREGFKWPASVKRAFQMQPRN